MHHHDLCVHPCTWIHMLFLSHLHINKWALCWLVAACKVGVPDKIPARGIHKSVNRNLFPCGLACVHPVVSVQPVIGWWIIKELHSFIRAWKMVSRKHTNSHPHLLLAIWKLGHFEARARFSSSTIVQNLNSAFQYCDWKLKKKKTKKFFAPTGMFSNVVSSYFANLLQENYFFSRIYHFCRNLLHQN